MEHQVDLPTTLYKRLEAHAKGFDTPINVIERILDFYEAHQNIPAKAQVKQSVSLQVKSFTLEVMFFPNDEKAFKRALLNKKNAWVKLCKIDGSYEIKLWKAQSFTEKSDLMGNLRSGYLRGWKTKGICKALIAIDKGDIS